MKFFETGIDGACAYFCPACGEHHVLTANWTITGPAEFPTVRPSVLVRTGHYAAHGKEHGCWCTHNAERVAEGRDPVEFKCSICHSFITNGKIEYLNDCTHELAGQSIPMVEPRL